MEQSDIIEVEPDEVDDVIETWGYSIVAFAVGGFPGFEAINRLTNSWKVHSTFKVYKSGWLGFFDLIVKRIDKRDKHHISFARLLVDVDLAKDLVREVTIKLPYGVLPKQAIIFENVPKFCSSCKQHSKGSSNTVGQQRGPSGGQKNQGAVGEVSGLLKGDLSDSGQQLGQLGGSLVQGKTGIVQQNSGQIQKHKTASSSGLTSENNNQQKHASKPAESKSIYGADGQFSGQQGGRKKALLAAFLAVCLLKDGTDLGTENSGMMQGVPGQQQASLMQAVSEIIATKTRQNQAVLPAPTTPIFVFSDSLKAFVEFLLSLGIVIITHGQIILFGLKIDRAMRNQSWLDSSLQAIAIKRNAKRKFISSLTKDDGSTSSVDEIHSEFLSYFSNLLGTRDDVDDFEAIVKKDFSPLVKRIISIRDKIIEAEGSIPNAISHLSSWHFRGSFDTLLAYDFFRPMGQRMIWHRVVDQTCKLCNQMKETRSDLFFGFLLPKRFGNTLGSGRNLREDVYY
ncbi:hypothetical protein M9H77_13838 [Catharanthus roseus]|uniref:Uncharacterized protein n=1 Tax=Catharanthus roseus TaxID=4058 RepID=A0ACC0BLB9_CATRO|nr:hypothetical protein M9H77_13838 [Catharanthus roseus]